MRMRHGVVPVNAPGSLGWMSIMVRHRVSLETIVIIFVNGIVLTVLPCSLLPGSLLLALLRLLGS